MHAGDAMGNPRYCSPSPRESCGAARQYRYHAGGPFQRTSIADDWHVYEAARVALDDVCATPTHSAWPRVVVFHLRQHLAPKRSRSGRSRFAGASPNAWSKVANRADRADRRRDAGTTGSVPCTSNIFRASSSLHSGAARRCADSGARGPNENDRHLFARESFVRRSLLGRAIVKHDDGRHDLVQDVQQAKRLPFVREPSSDDEERKTTSAAALVVPAQTMEDGTNVALIPVVELRRLLAEHEDGKLHIVLDFQPGAGICAILSWLDAIDSDPAGVGA